MWQSQGKTKRTLRFISATSWGQWAPKNKEHLADFKSTKESYEMGQLCCFRTHFSEQTRFALADIIYHLLLSRTSIHILLLLTYQPNVRIQSAIVLLAFILGSSFEVTHIEASVGGSSLFRRRMCFLINTSKGGGVVNFFGIIIYKNCTAY